MSLCRTAVTGNSYPVSNSLCRTAVKGLGFEFFETGGPCQVQGIYDSGIGGDSVQHHLRSVSPTTVACTGSHFGARPARVRAPLGQAALACALCALLRNGLGSLTIWEHPCPNNPMTSYAAPLHPTFTPWLPGS